MGGACNVEYNASKTTRPVEVRPFCELPLPRVEATAGCCHCLGHIDSSEVRVNVLSRGLIDKYPQTTFTRYRHNLKTAKYVMVTNSSQST